MSAYVELRADDSKFAGDSQAAVKKALDGVEASTKRAMSGVGDAVKGSTDKMGAAVDGAGNKIVSNAGRGKAAFGSMLGSVNASGVLGPFGDALDKVQGKLDGIGKMNVGKSLMAGGAGALAVGGIATAIGSKEQAASQQLKAAIDATGGSYEDFAKKIEASIKSNEHFGQSSVETQDALRILTQSTGDTGTALADMGVVANLAAAKHESLTAAATSLARVHGGATKVLKEFGVTAEK